MAVVTIGIPVYNEEKHLAETIESAIKQEFRNIDIVISDNGSTDRSAEIINYYSQLDSRIKPVFLGKNMGGAANFWSLLNNTSTKYFVMLGAHDLFLPHYIGEAVSYLEENPDYVMTYPESRLVDGNDELLKYSDSDIDSAGLNHRQRMAKVVAKLSWCTCFHGVFRTDVIRKLPTLRIRGADNLMLFATAYYGKIHWIHSLGILRRESRQETREMIEARRVKAGAYIKNGGIFNNPLSVMVLEHLNFIFYKTRFSFLKKILLSLSVTLLFKRKYKVSFMSIVFSYLLSSHH